MARRAVIKRSGVLRAFDDDNPQRHSGDDAVADRKILRRGKRAHRELADDCAALLAYRRKIFLFSFG